MVCNFVNPVEIGGNPVLFLRYPKAAIVGVDGGELRMARFAAAH
jgi:hypothetical protein